MAITVEYQSTNYLDDGYLNRYPPAAWLPADGFVYVGNNASYRLDSFFRWPGVTIPAGATITAASIRVSYMAYYGGQPTACRLHFEKVATPAAVSSIANYDAKPLTSAYVDWIPPIAVGWQTSPDISQIIQELVNSYSYATGAAMQALWSGYSGYGSQFVKYASQDNSGYGAILHIEYTTKMQIGACVF
jgi:hypothetical protein